jgi:sugar/nucleoside kinase (ribokinase family)
VLQATQAKHLITTLGRRGLVVFDRQSQDPTSPGWDGRLRSEHLQPINGRAVDALGCGDALLAGCTLALCCGAGLIQAAYIGNLMAGIEAGEVGNIPINMRMLRQCLDTRPELVSQRMSNSEAMVENR